MATLEERIEAAAAVRELVESPAGAQLYSLPGVYHLAEGLRHRRGLLTPELCIRVYVREKLPWERLSPAERVPRELNGVPTDVNVQDGPFQTLAADYTNYRPVKGGSMITNGIMVIPPGGGPPAMEEGTFGITATRNSDQDIMLLSCYHILMANGAKKGSPIFQPTYNPTRLPAPAQTPALPQGKKNRIAKVSHGVLNEKVDAAVARIEVSSCCRSCGIDWRDEVVGLSQNTMPPSNQLRGMRAAVVGEPVIKRGAVSGRTEGTVFCTNLPDIPLTVEGQQITFKGQIGIQGPDNQNPFSMKGDSGSVVVGLDGFVVGMLFASTEYSTLVPDTANYIKGACSQFDTQVGMAMANHISDVMSELRITINLDRSTHNSAGPPPFMTLDEDERARFAEARERVRTDPAGAWIWALAEQHQEEAVNLVRHHRPVTVAWHRAGGPALLATALNTLRAGGDTLPAPPDGGTLESALIRIGDALRTHGSPALREAIGRHRELLLAVVRESSTVTELLARLRPHVPAAVPVLAGVAYD